ncbi:MAG: UDP-3-O-[3-hydroxymyristoyl] N-acetylglucosamine deacetylase, partial [Elusimicrobia bacterium]|nr:UDP-3-O-[3-hydroxymyristoyl] N-acetylglucosamine deacetylase [Elusimicrobiota bacterium]
EKMSDNQCTIDSEATISGIGIHTGKMANVRFRPAGVDEGIRFVRVDLPGSPGVPASIDYVTGVKRGTTIEKGSAKVQTIEHLLATVYGLGIDNMIVEIDTEELPVGDGSSKDYTKVLQNAGIKEQDKPKKYFKPTRVINYKKDDTELVVVPSDSLSVSSTIHYHSNVLNSQFISLEINRDTYVKEIASARTYCFEDEIAHIKDWGLGKGGTYENTIVIGEKGITNTKLRFKDEFVRHKILDLLGDIFLLGVRLKGNIMAVRSGHASNIELTRRLRENFLEAEGEGSDVELDAEKILKILPHRYPFLMVDRITMGHSRKVATGYKNITINEPFFKGHFPDNPIFPSSLIVEFMAQSSAVMLLSRPELMNKLAYFIIIENAEFFNEVRPMDTLVSKVELVRAREKGARVRGVSYIKDRKVAEAEFMFSVVDR